MDLPLSEAVGAGGLVFLSGTAPLKEGTVFAPEDVKAQTLFIIERIRKTLERFGLTLEHLAYVQVYLRTLDDYTAMNEVYAACIPAPYPARKVIVAPLPNAQVCIEISGIASSHPKQI